jgi:hypothetical protein
MSFSHTFDSPIYKASLLSALSYFKNFDPIEWPLVRTLMPWAFSFPAAIALCRVRRIIYGEATLLVLLFGYPQYQSQFQSKRQGFLESASPATTVVPVCIVKRPVVKFLTTLEASFGKSERRIY